MLDPDYRYEAWWGWYLQIAGYKLPSNQGNQISVADPGKARTSKSFHIACINLAEFKCNELQSNAYETVKRGAGEEQ